MFRLKSNRLVRGVILASLAAIALTASAERRCIYYIGSFSGWYEPTESNAAHFENFKIYETAEGSNIFSGEITPGSEYYGGDHYFRFYYSLLPEAELSEVNTAWGINTICPEGGKGDGIELDSKSLVNKMRFTHFVCNNNEVGDVGGGAWVVRGREGTPLKVTLNFNTNELTVVTSGYLLVMDGQPEPTADTVDAYHGPGTKVYVPEGPCRFRAYNLYSQQYCGVYTNNDIEVTSTQVYLHPYRHGTGSFVVPNWGGGVLQIDGNYLNITNNWQALNNGSNNPYNPDDYTNNPGIIGDFNGWSGDVDMEGTGYRFTGTVPAGANEWKVRINHDWVYNLGIDYDKEAVTSGATTFFVLAPGGNTFSLGTPLPEDYKMTIDLDRKIGWIWPASQAQADPIPDGFYDRNNDTLQPPVIYPFTGALVITPNDSFDFSAIPASQVLNACRQAENYAGSYTFSVNSNESFCIYEFDNDKFVRALCPNGNNTLYFANGAASSRVISVTDPAQATMWSFDPNVRFGSVDVTINPDDTSLTGAKFEMASSRDASCIYLVGNVSGWMYPDVSNAESYEPWTLRKTESGEYYGEFYMDAAPMFRFYSALTGWDGGDSWGPQYDDYPVDFYDFAGEVSYTLVNGKGSYSFTDRGAGMMYILVDLNNGRVTFSNSPIAHSDFVDPNEAQAEEVCQMFVEGETRELQILEPGVYFGSYYTTPGTISDFRIFKSAGPRQISINDPEWEGSYALKFNPGSDGVVFDEGGVAEVGFEYIDHITTERVAPLTVTTPGYTHYIVVDFNASKLYIDRRTSSYIVGTPTDGKRPTYATRAEFESVRVESDGSSYILDLPAGDSEFEIYALGNPAPQSPAVELRFENGVAEAPTNSVYLPNIKVVDFEGGLAAFARTYKVDTDENGFTWYKTVIKGTQLDKVETINIHVGDKVIPMHRSRAAEDNIFTGSFDFRLTDAASVSYSIVTDLGAHVGVYYNAGDESPIRILYKADNEEYDDCYLTGYESATVNIAVNLTDLTALINLTNAKKLKAENIVIPASAGYYNYYNSYNYAKPGVEDFVSGTFSINEFTIIDGETSFNIIDENNNLLVPDGDGFIDFSDEPTRLLAFRRLTDKDYTIDDALTAPKWHFAANLSDNYVDNIVGVTIDENSGCLQVTYNNSRNDLYGAIVKDGKFPTQYSQISDYRLSSTDDGCYTVTLPIATGEGFAIVSGAGYDGSFCGRGIASRNGKNGVIEMQDDEAEVLVGNSLVASATYWTIADNTGANYEITYDPTRCAIRVSRVADGVESVAVDSRVIVRAIDGGIEVLSDAAVSIPVYNIAGVLVANVRAAEGAPGRVSLAPGVYLTAGHKILVK